MKTRLFAVLLSGAFLCVSPSFAQNGQGQNDDGQGKVHAPEFDAQTAALGLALAVSAVAAVKGRFKRRGQ